MASDSDPLVEYLSARLEEARERARAAREVSAALAVRAEVFAALIRHFRERPDDLLLRCSWCSRIGLGYRFVVADVPLGELPAAVAERTTHGICPDCAERLRYESPGGTAPPPRER